MSAVHFQAVTFRYELTPDVHALDGVNLELSAGSLSLVSGPSGSGKSTLCRLVAGYAPHQFEGTLDGSVQVAGLDVAAVSIGALAEHVGVVFEDPFDQLTGATRTLFDEVAFGLENRGRPADEVAGRARAALERVGLGAIYERHPRELSGGQCQRLAIATILAVEPSVLVLDEPTSQLDPVGAREVANLVAEMRGSGMTIVVVTQELDRWLPIADQLICLKAGRIRAQGSPRRVLAHVENMDGLLPPASWTVWRALRARGLVDRDSEPPLDVTELADAIGSRERGTR